MAQATAVFEGAGVQIYRWDATANMLVPALGNDIAAADGAAHRPLGVGAAGRAAQQRAPVLIDGYSECVGPATPAGRAGVLAAMGAPIFSGGQLIGAISVGIDHQRMRLGPEQLETLQALATEWSRVDHLALVSAMYDQHRRPALGLAYRLLRDRYLAEEAVQDVFFAVWRSGAKYDPAKGSVRTWVLTMVHRRAVDLHRMRARRPVCPIDDRTLEVQGGTDPSVDAQQSLDRAQVCLALMDLPPKQREAIELAYFGGLSHTEIAATLQMPVGTIKGRIRLALDNLRRAPGSHLVAGSEPAPLPPISSRSRTGPTVASAYQ